MSVVSLLGVKVLNNPAKFGDKYEFEITFECLEQLQKGMIYPQVQPNWMMLTCLFRSGMEAHLCRLCYLVSYKTAFPRLLSDNHTLDPSTTKSSTRFSLAPSQLASTNSSLKQTPLISRGSLLLKFSV